jgi:hypothetical protein
MTLADPSPRLLHVLSISTRSSQACLEAVADILGRCGGQMRGFTLKPAGSGFEAVLRVTGIDEAAAWRLAGLINAWPEAGTAHLEHQVLST